MAKYCGFWMWVSESYCDEVLWGSADVKGAKGFGVGQAIYMVDTKGSIMVTCGDEFPEHIGVLLCCPDVESVAGQAIYMVDTKGLITVTCRGNLAEHTGVFWCCADVESVVGQAIYMVDTKGLITVTRGDKLAEHKVAVARRDGTPDMKSLKDIVAYVKPHALIGLSGAGPAFTQVRRWRYMQVDVVCMKMCCIRLRRCLRAHSHARAQHTCACTGAQAHAHTHTHTHIYTHTGAHTHTHTHTRVRTHTQSHTHMHTNSQTAQRNSGRGKVFRDTSSGLFVLMMKQHVHVVRIKT
jgi:hypothetical protein